MNVRRGVNVGLVGYGLAGRVFHGRLLAACPEVSVVAVVTRSAERRAEAAADLPGVACFDTAEEMLAAAGPDLAIVASPNGTHAPIAGACLDAGSAVVVDKPLAVSAHQARELLAHPRAGRLTVFQNRRWDSDQLTLRKLRDGGALGDVLRYESRFERWRPVLTSGKWREHDTGTGGVLRDLGSHLVDQAVTLFGPVRSVYAEVDARRGAADDDAFLALTHDGGVYSHLWCGVLAGAPGPRLRVLGTSGALVVDRLDGQEEALRAGRSPSGVTVPARLVRGDESIPVDPMPGAWDSFYPAVLAALRDGAPMPVDPWDAVHVLDVLDAARTSAAERRAVDVST